MTGPAGEVPTHLMIDLGSAETLVLHKSAFEMMGAEKTNLVDLSFDSVSFKDVKVYAQEEFKEVEQITKDNAAALEEVPVSGILGMGVMGEQAVQLDLPGHAIRIGRIEEMAKSEGKSAVELDYESTTRGLIVPGDLPDGGRVRVQFATRQYESLVGFEPFQSLRIGQENPVPVRIGAIDLVSYGAFRPSGMKGIPRPAPELVLGIELLSRFRVTVDPQARKIRFETIGPPLPHAAEQAYFLADYANNGDAIEQFLQANPDSWLKTEAAARLMELRLGSTKSTEAACLKAMDLFAASLPADVRSQQMIAVADQVLSAREGRELAILRKALELASRDAGEDMNAAAVHQINARKGLLAMREGNLKDARRLLLSAAFGTPGDVKVNLWLGEFYRLNKQPARAWSRYVEAALSEEAPPEAIRALEELGRDPAFRQSFGVADAELMLEGRLLGYAPPRLRSNDETASVHLVELFSNGTGAGSVGPQLAFDGLLQFFAGTPVVFLSYHLDPSLGNTTAASRVGLYGIMQPPAIVCDGKTIDMDGADATGAQRLFEKYLKQIAGPTPASPMTLEGQAAWKGPRLEAQVRLKRGQLPMEAKDLRLYAIVCERCVFTLGGNGTGLHYAVARGSMSDKEGLSIDTKQSEQSWNLGIDLAQMSRPPRKPTTAAATQPAGAGPPWMRGPDPDPRECSVILIVQDAATFKVLQAAKIEPTGGQP